MCTIADSIIEIKGETSMGAEKLLRDRVEETLRAKAPCKAWGGRKTYGVMWGIMKMRQKPFEVWFIMNSLHLFFHCSALIASWEWTTMLFDIRDMEHVLWWWPNDCSRRLWCSSQTARSIHKLFPNHVVRKGIHSVDGLDPTLKLYFFDAVGDLDHEICVGQVGILSLDLSHCFVGSFFHSLFVHVFDIVMESTSSFTNVAKVFIAVDVFGADVAAS